MVGKQDFNNSKQLCLLKEVERAKTQFCSFNRETSSHENCLPAFLPDVYDFLFQEIFCNEATKPPGIYPYCLVWSS